MQLIVFWGKGRDCFGNTTFSGDFRSLGKLSTPSNQKPDTALISHRTTQKEKYGEYKTI